MSLNWSHVLALSLGVSKTTTLADQVVARVTGTSGGRPYTKSAFATLLAIIAGVYLGRDGRERLLIASAVAGGAAVVHDRVMEGGPVSIVAAPRGPQSRSL